MGIISYRDITSSNLAPDAAANAQKLIDALSSDGAEKLGLVFVVSEQGKMSGMGTVKVGSILFKPPVERQEFSALLDKLDGLAGREKFSGGMRNVTYTEAELDRAFSAVNKSR